MWSKRSRSRAVVSPTPPPGAHTRESAPPLLAAGRVSCLLIVPCEFRQLLPARRRQAELHHAWLLATMRGAVQLVHAVRYAINGWNYNSTTHHSLPSTNCSTTARLACERAMTPAMPPMLCRCGGGREASTHSRPCRARPSVLPCTVCVCPRGKARARCRMRGGRGGGRDGRAQRAHLSTQRSESA